MFVSGRVPIREVRQELAAEAPASIRNMPARKAQAETSTQERKPSLQQLLSEREQDWLIDADELEICLDAKGNKIKLGSGAFGTVYPFSLPHCFSGPHLECS